jgi:hypothetical protein
LKVVGKLIWPSLNLRRGFTPICCTRIVVLAELSHFESAGRNRDSSDHKAAHDRFRVRLHQFTRDLAPPGCGLRAPITAIQGGTGHMISDRHMFYAGGSAEKIEIRYPKLIGAPSSEHDASIGELRVSTNLFGSFKLPQIEVHGNTVLNAYRRRFSGGRSCTPVPLGSGT